MRSGFYFRIRRQGKTFEARRRCPVGLAPANDMRYAAAAAALAAGYADGRWRTVTRWVRSGAVAPERCSLRDANGCLAQD